ncbi:MAG: hypothetical protein AB7V43_09440 [Acidimicrobiia bacterium]
MPPPPGLPPLGAPPSGDLPLSSASPGGGYVPPAAPTTQWSGDQYSAPATPPKLKPSKSGIWIGVLLMAAGIISGIAIIVVSLVRVSDRVDKFPRVAVGSSYEMNFSESGDYVVYLEYDGDDEPATPEGLYVCAVKTGGSGECKDDPDKLPVRSYTNDLSFSFNGTQGKAVFKFEIPDAGKYVFASEASENSPRLMVGPSVLNALVGPILLSFAIGGLLFLIGLVLFIVTLVRRKRARRAFGSMPPSSTWSPGAPPMPVGAPAPPSAGGWTPPPPPGLQ